MNHSDREAEKFYGELAARGVGVRVGMEATGYSRWCERLLAELGIEVWIGNIFLPEPSLGGKAVSRQAGNLLRQCSQRNRHESSPRLASS